MGRRAGKRPSQRQLRVAEELRHILAKIIQRGELNDPELADVPVTVSEVRISPDLRNATAFVAPLGSGDPDTLVKAMERAASFIRQRIGQEVSLRYVPAISFRADRSYDDAYRIGVLLKSSSAHTRGNDKA